MVEDGVHVLYWFYKWFRIINQYFFSWCDERCTVNCQRSYWDHVGSYLWMCTMWNSVGLIYKKQLKEDVFYNNLKTILTLMTYFSQHLQLKKKNVYYVFPLRKLEICDRCMNREPIIFLFSLSFLFNSVYPLRFSSNYSQYLGCIVIKTIH